MGNKTEKQKFDLIATSKKKGYKITMGVLIGLGVVCFLLGLLLKMTVTNTVVPNRLDVDFTGRQTTTIANQYTAQISDDIYLNVDTGTNNKALVTPIRITMDKNAQKFLTTPVTTAYRDGKPFKLTTVQDPELDGTTGYLYVECGSYKVTIYFRYVYDTNAHISTNA